MIRFVNKQIQHEALEHGSILTHGKHKYIEYKEKFYMYTAVDQLNYMPYRTFYQFDTLKEWMIVMYHPDSNHLDMVKKYNICCKLERL
jgi:hypothetical protein